MIITSDRNNCFVIVIPVSMSQACKQEESRAVMYYMALEAEALSLSLRPNGLF